MARRRRRKISNSRTVNTKVVVFQIIALLAFLIAIFAVQDTIGERTGMIFDSLTGDDVDVQAPQDDADFSGRRTDDGTESTPADQDVDAPDDERPDVDTDDALPSAQPVDSDADQGQ